MSDRNFGLDLHEGRARVVVDWARGYARESGSAALTLACSSLDEFEAEIARLHAELDDILDEARPGLGAEVRQPVEPESEAEAEPAAAVRPAGARLDTDLLVQDVMVEQVRTLAPNDTLIIAEELMKQNKFRHVVVVDDDRVVGVVSQRDIFHGALAWSLGQGEIAHEKALSTMPVKQVMVTRVVDIGPKQPLADAAARMREHGIGCLPVVEGDRLRGIITEGDFLALITA